MTKAILLMADDWEMLYIDGILKDEAHTLNEGTSRIKYFLDLAKKYDFDLAELKEIYLSEEDEEGLQDSGSGFHYLKDWKDIYD